MEQLIDTKTAAALLGLRECTIRKYCMLRMLPFRKHGTRVVFSPSELESWSNARRIPTLDEAKKNRHERAKARGKIDQEHEEANTMSEKDAELL